MRGVFTFNKGKTDGGPIWYEMKASGHRLSLEYGDIEYKNHKGYFRSYNSDRSMSNLDCKSAKPGYLNSIGKIKEKTELNGKVFCENGDIKEGKLVICEEQGRGVQIDGFIWKLKEDGMYAKFKMEIAEEEKEGTEVIKRSDKEYEIRTFICNEHLD